MKKLLLPLCVLLGLTIGGLLACGDDGDDPKAMISAMCESYARCDMLKDMMGMFGSNAEECKQRMTSLPGQGTGTGTGTGTPCTIDTGACASAMKAQSCEDMKAGTTLPACECPR